MTFQIKDFVSIVAGMINHMRGHQREVTDFNIGSVARTLIEGPAAELDEAYQQLVNGIREAIPVATYNSFNFQRLPAVPASGMVRVTISGSTETVVIPAGTLFTGQTTKTAFRSITDAAIVPGLLSVDILVTAMQPGSAGNVLQGETFSLGPRPPTFVSATNLAAISNGADQESDDQRKERFIAYINTLQRATGAAIKYGAETVVLYTPEGAETERVRTCFVDEPYQRGDLTKLAMVSVYIHNGVGGTSDELVARTAEVLHGYTDANGQSVPGWKAAGVKVDVFKAVEKVLDLEATLTAKAGFDAAGLAEHAESVLAEYVRSIPIGGTFLVAEAIYLVKSIEGVNDFVFSTPSGHEVVSTFSEKLVMGAITVTPA